MDDNLGMFFWWTWEVEKFQWNHTFMISYFLHSVAKLLKGNYLVISDI